MLANLTCLLTMPTNSTNVALSMGLSDVSASNKAFVLGFKAIEIEINHDCNRACSYCPNSIAERKSSGKMSEQLFNKIMTELKALNFQGRVSFHFYNEPLLNPDLDHFVALTKTFLAKCRIEIFTNGTLLTKDRLITLIDRGVDKFTVTRHHGIKQLPIEAIYENLEPNIKSKLKLQSYNELIYTSRGGLMNVGHTKKTPPLDLPCYIPSAVLVVTKDGNVVPCFEDYFEQNVMGNINDNSLEEIWNSEKYKNFRDRLKMKLRHELPVCKSCNNILIVP